MTEKTEKQGESPSKDTEGTHADEELYLYKDAGIAERHGAVPLWLKLVCYGLILWGIYYTLRYWSTE
jgi:hypothetical protein